MPIVGSGTAVLVRALILALACGSVARADLAPINACSMPGQPCGDDGMCTCAETTCKRQIPCSNCGDNFRCDGGTSADDAGGNDFCLASYDCNLCLKNGAACPTLPGVGGKGGSGGKGGAGAPSDGGTEPSEDDDGCSCAASNGDLPGGALVAFAVLLWLVRRRKPA